MSEIDFSKIVKPLSADDPCGPDLDLEGDSAFMNYMAQAETALPPDFFKRDGTETRIFDRADYDFDGQIKIVGRLLERTRDARLLALAGRLHALKMDLHGCAEGLAATATLLRDRWDEIHPRAEDGDFGYRLGVLQSLNDMTTMILPLQHLPLFRSRRFGGISQRTCLLTAGRAAPRTGEAVLDEAELRRALREADPEEVEASRTSIAGLGAAARAIAAVTAERVGMEQSVRLDRLIELADEVLAFLDSAAPPSAAASPEAGEGPVSVGQEVGPASGPVAGQALVPVAISERVASAATAGAALAAASRYFRDNEPSSPAVLLLHQAERLIGLPFQDLLRTLLPQHADGATLFIGPKPERSFQINLERIASEAEPVAVPAEDGPSVPVFVAASRAEAVSLMREAAAFFRRQEPSSPVPLFIDRAGALLNQDFLALLADVLPGVRLARDE